MENANKDVNQVINQMQMIKFQGVFMAAWNLLLKEPVLLIALVLAPMLLNGILEGYVWPPLLNASAASSAIGAVLLSIVLGIVSALIAFFGSGLILRAASRVFDGKKIDVGETVSFVQAHFVDAIKLAIQLFIYTGAWLILVYLAAMVLLVPLAPAVAGILTMLLPIALIVYIIAFFKKIINSSMSYAIFWSAEKPEVDGSLKRSLELCDKLTWTIFGNYILLGLVGALASFVIVAVFGAILAVLGRGGVALTSAIASGVIGTFYALFQYCLKGQVEKFRGSTHHEAHHAASHHS
jgi:MFS family permease